MATSWPPQRRRHITAFAYWAAAPYIPAIRDFAALASRPSQGLIRDDAEARRSRRAFSWLAISVRDASFPPAGAAYRMEQEYGSETRNARRRRIRAVQRLLRRRHAALQPQGTGRIARRTRRG